MVFYRSFRESIKELPEANQLEIYNAIFDYSFDFEEPELNGLSKAIFSLIRPNLDANIRKYFNGSTGGRPKLTETKPKPNKNLTETKQKPKRNQSESKPYPNVDEDVDEDEDVEKKPVSVFSDLPDEKMDYGFYPKTWNNSLLNHSKVSALTDKRKRSIKARLPEFGKTKEEQQAVFGAILDKIKASPFLSGENDRGWRPDFDWLLKNSDNWRKIYEGKFDKKAPQVATASAGGNTVTLPNGKTVALGVGEYIHERGHRTLGSGVNKIPIDAPPRPSAQYYWDRVNNVWQFNGLM